MSGCRIISIAVGSKMNRMLWKFGWFWNRQRAVWSVRRMGEISTTVKLSWFAYACFLAHISCARGDSSASMRVLSVHWADCGESFDIEGRCLIPMILPSSCGLTPIQTKNPTIPTNTTAITADITHTILHLRLSLALSYSI